MVVNEVKEDSQYEELIEVISTLRQLLRPTTKVLPVRGFIFLVKSSKQSQFVVINDH